MRLLTTWEALEQMLQVCERDMAETDEAVSGLKGEGLLSGKRKRGKELAHQAVMHSLGEQVPLGTGHYARQGRTGSEGTRQWWSVEAGLVRAGDVAQCPVPTGGEGGNGEGLTRDKVGGAAPGEGAVESAGVEGATTARLEPPEEALEQVLQECEHDKVETDEALSDIMMGVLAGKKKRGEELAHQHVRHSLWEQDSLEAYNELLFG